jgi:hypothetical protein
LLGASTSLRGAEDRSNRDAVEVAEAALSALSPEAYDDAYSRGLALTREEVLALFSERTAAART